MYIFPIFKFDFLSTINMLLSHTLYIYIFHKIIYFQLLSTKMRRHYVNYYPFKVQQIDTFKLLDEGIIHALLH